MISKIIFYDGNFHKLPAELKCKYLVIDAKDGYSATQSLVKFLVNCDQEVKILTNDLLVWGNEEAWWDLNTNSCQAYILKQINGKWKDVNIQNLIEKEIRKAHNIVKIYMANGFNDKPICSEDIKCPKYATVLSRNVKYPIYYIHFGTRQLTLEESDGLYNIVSIDDVDFDFSDMTIEEATIFNNKFSKVFCI